MDFSIGGGRRYEALMNPGFSSYADFLHRIDSPVVLTPGLDVDFARKRFYIIIENSSRDDAGMPIFYQEVLGYGNFDFLDVPEVLSYGLELKMKKVKESLPNPEGIFIPNYVGIEIQIETVVPNE